MATQLDPPALSLPDQPFPTGVTTGILGDDDRLATSDELAEALTHLTAITGFDLNHLHASDYAREAVGHFHRGDMQVGSVDEAHDFFAGALRGSHGQTVAQYLHLALSQVGTIESPPGSNHTKYNDWFAGLYGHEYHACAWCAIFQSWVGQGGAIPASRRSAGAEALVYNFPDKGQQPGALIYYTFSHVECYVKSAGNPYHFTVGGNTSDNGQHTDGVWYVRRNLNGIVGHYGMPDYQVVAPPHDHLEKNGNLAITGVFGHYTINHLKRRLNHLFPKQGPLKINGVFTPRTIRRLQEHLGIKQTGTCHQPTVRHLQAHLHVKQDGDWGPHTTEALQHRLNLGTF